MPRKSDFTLPNLDDLFSTQEQRDEQKLAKIRDIPIELIGKHLYQWTAIDECTRKRFIYAFEEHTPENSVKFLKMLVNVFPFKIQTIQTDNETEFTYKYISDTQECPFDKALRQLEINHKLIPPRTLDYKSPKQLLEEKLAA